MKLSKSSCLSLLIGLIAAISAPQAAFSNTLGETSISHYKRANAHVKRGNHRQAVHEYKQAYRLAPNSTVGKYSLRALAYYGLSKEEVGIAKTNNFAKQAEEMKARSAQDAQNRINSRSKHIAGEIRKIEEDERASIENINRNPSYKTVVAPFNNFYHPVHRRYYQANHGQLIRTVDPVATQARIDAVRADAQARKDKLTGFSNGKADQLIASHHKRANMLDEMADNLQSQMFGKGVKLNPNGSNLYVRSYR